MKTPTLFKEYIWLVNTIRKAGRITLAEINERWALTEMSGGLPLARTTFNRHKDAIEHIFGIFIDCDRRGGYKYYIGNAQVLGESSVQNWMLSTLSVNNLVSESLSLQHRILLENIPTDGHRLLSIIDAMKQNRMINVQYRRYQSDEIKSYVVAPYCIKLYHRRWYVLVKYDNQKMGILSLDRIEHLELCEKKFKIDDEFDGATFFRECFGVMTGEDIASEQIVVRAYGTEVCYLRDLPMHHSQRLIKQGKNFADFELNLRPTNDFKGHLLSRGKRIKVLKPQHLAQEIKLLISEALQLYQSSE